MSTHLLTLTVFSPLLGALLVLLFPSSQEKKMRTAAVLSSFAPLFFSLLLFARFQGGGNFEFEENVLWLPLLSIRYRVGVDGFSLPLMVLTTLLMPLVLLQSWREFSGRLRGFLLLLFLLETGILGVFASLDLFLFYVFWEVMLVPMYFLIGGWGGSRRLYASFKFVLYTLAGSLLMFAAMIYLYFAGGKTFDLESLYALNLPLKTEVLLFAAFALAFAVKIPLFPFHTWLPDAHVEAPTAGSVFLAGLLLKMGIYGFVRFAIPLFPQATLLSQPLFVTLAVIGILYGSLVAMVQPDLKKLVAYTSIAHLGFVVLGLFSRTSEGVAGAALQMINHGVSTGALFLLVGMVYERAHTRQVADFGGLTSAMPLYGVVFLIVTLSSIGLPITNGFVGEFLILMGSFKTNAAATGLATLGVFFGALAMLRMYQRIFFGPLQGKSVGLQDLSLREACVILPLIVIIFWMGIAPQFLLKKMDASVSKFVERSSWHNGKAVKATPEEEWNIHR